ncbi:hypothetical protein VPH35_057365 [Triticum aestivum]|uniref:Glycosyltransferase 61 catalytic domain-containing protein n=1 Tax=Aegilops tauschii TaxID=37682 RepID=N1QR23_AEGTA
MPVVLVVVQVLGTLHAGPWTTHVVLWFFEFMNSFGARNPSISLFERRCPLRRVRFLVTDYKQLWPKKYKPILRRLSCYDIVDFDSNNDVHCFHHVILGLLRDRNLIIRRHPTRNPKGHSMVGFTRFLRRAYGLRRDRPLALGENSGKKPRMLIISRRGTRRLLNLHQVETMATLVGFDVTVSEARDNDIKRFAETVNSCDVLVAVHGAGLTNQVFLPARAVVVQIVP